MSVKRHPICDELGIPEPTRETIEAIAEDMKEYGWDARLPSWWYEGKCLVGNTREAAAKIAKVEPVRKEFRGDAEKARAFCYRNETPRRLLTAEQVARMKAARVARVAEARAEGKSIRDIAEAEGVSRGTVANDIQAAGVQGLDTCPPEGKVAGKDGKKYTAARDQGDASEAPILCDRCQRVGGVKGCSECEVVRAAAARRAAKREGKVTGPQKNGQLKYDEKPYRDGAGLVKRAADTAARLYGQRESPEHKAVHEAFKKFDGEFWKFIRFCRETKRPAKAPA